MESCGHYYSIIVHFVRTNNTLQVSYEHIICNDTLQAHMRACAVRIFLSRPRIARCTAHCLCSSQQTCTCYMYELSLQASSELQAPKASQCVTLTGSSLQSKHVLQINYQVPQVTALLSRLYIALHLVRLACRELMAQSLAQASYRHPCSA